MLNPKNLSEVIESITTIGNVIGNLDQSYNLRNKLQLRLDEIGSMIRNKNLDGHQDIKDRILCLDWINPFYIAGHWVSDMICQSGGRSLNGKIGQDSTRISTKRLTELDPDKLIIAPCGFDLDRTHGEYKLVNETNWEKLTAFKSNQIYLVDSGSYFSKPSPRLITGIEILCKITNPALFKNLNLPAKSAMRVIKQDVVSS